MRSDERSASKTASDSRVFLEPGIHPPLCFAVFYTFYSEKVR